MVFVLVSFCFNQGGGISAQLNVVISSGPLVDSGTDTTLTCTSTESGGTLREVRWSKGPINGTINDADGIVLYVVGSPIQWGSVDQSHYEFDLTASGVPLTIKSVSRADEAQYWCTLNFGVREYGSAAMRVRGEIRRRAQFHHTLLTAESALTVTISRLRASAEFLR